MYAVTLANVDFFLSFLFLNSVKMQSLKSLLIILLLWRQTVAGNIKKPLKNERKNLDISSNARLLKLLELEERFMDNMQTYTNKLAEKVNSLQA